MADDADKIALARHGDEQRILSRHHLIYYLRVYDNTSTKVIGHVVDISPRGVMLISEAPVPLEKEFRLRMRFPGMSSSRDELIFEAVCRWCRPDVNPDFFLAGFQIQNLPPEEANFIQGMINELGM